MLTGEQCGGGVEDGLGVGVMPPVPGIVGVGEIGGTLGDTVGVGGIVGVGGTLGKGEIVGITVGVGVGVEPAEPPPEMTRATWRFNPS